MISMEQRRYDRAERYEFVKLINELWQTGTQFAVSFDNGVANVTSHPTRESLAPSPEPPMQAA